MEMNQIRYFLEVAESQHITRSAEKLHIAQPALTQSIHRLEASLGVPLFVSKGRNIVLTEYGKYLRERLLPIMEQLDRIPGQLLSMAQLENETIHLNVLAASTFITEAIIAYKRKQKDLNFHWIQNFQEDISDIEITTKMFYRPGEEQKNRQFVCNEKIYLAVPNKGKFAGRTSVRLEEMMHEGFISLIGSQQFRAICDKFCHHAGFHPHVIFESDNPSAVRNMIAANMGVGFWPEFTWGTIKSEHVLLLEIEELRCQRDLVITCNLNKPNTENVVDFFTFLCKFFERKKRKAESAPLIRF